MTNDPKSAELSAAAADHTDDEAKCRTCNDVGRLDCCDGLECEKCQGLFTRLCPDCEG